LPDPHDSAAERRYRLAAEIAQSAITRASDRAAESPSHRIDRIVLNKWLAYPVFFGVVWAMFQFTFSLSSPVAGRLGGAIGAFGSWVARVLGAMGTPAMVVAFLVDGVIAGLGALLEFAPPIFLLFFAISFLEDIGYMARAALISDRLMGAVGLHGKAFIPMILGFGCNVTGILAARSLDSPRDRLVSILVNPLISCSARLPVYVLFAAAFFPQRRGLVVFSLYALGVVLAALVAKVLSVFIKPDVSSTFVMELPPYRMPRVSGVLIQTWERGREFLHKAGTVILLAVVVVWALSNLPSGVAPGSPDSLIGRIGSAIAPLLRPAGFGTWQAAAALVFGAIAKELIVGTLGVLYGSGVGAGGIGLIGAIQAHWTPLSAYAFMVMALVYMPCAATIAAIRRETGSRAWTAFAMAYPLVLGWALAVIVYQVGHLIGLG
jgi:ferrous iron transport protein B